MQWFEPAQTVQWGQACSIALGAYVLGCITTGYYLVRWRAGQDLREIGSGTVGARNAGRRLGWTGFLCTVLGDSAKGALAVWATQYLTKDQRLAGVALVSVVAGHIWPAQLRFHGGKGIAAALGGLAVYDVRLALAVAVSFAVLYALVRKVVLAGLLAFACLPLVGAYLETAPSNLAAAAQNVICLSLLAALILAAHRHNLVSEFSDFLLHRSVPKQRPPEP